MTKWLKMGLIFGALVGFFTGCFPRKMAFLNDRQVLRVGNRAEPPTIDPHLMLDFPGIFVARGLFEGLVLLDPETLEPQPGVAEKWTISEDGKRYTFYLRDCCWSDGTPLVAQDFIRSIQRILTPSVAAPMANLAMCIQGAGPFYAGKADFSAVAVRALDDHILEIVLEHPTPYFLSMLAHPLFSPVLEKNLSDFGNFLSRDSRWTHPGNMISNGPFHLKEWSIGDHLTIERNRQYWNDKANAIDEVIFYPIGDDHSEFNAFQYKNLDITSTVPIEYIDDCRGKAFFHETASLSSFYYFLNCQKEPLNDVRIRRALSAAINRTDLCRLLRRDPSFSAHVLVPPGVKDYSYGGEKLVYDPMLARQLLAQAGFPNGKNFPTLTLTFNSSDFHRLVAQAIQEMWRKELSINIELRSYEWKVFTALRRNGVLDLGRGGWIGDYNDPVTFLELFCKGNSSNYSHWDKPSYDEGIRRSGCSNDTVEREKILNECEAILIDEVPVIPLFFDTNRHLVSTRVSHWTDNIIDYHLYQKFELER